MLQCKNVIIRPRCLSVCLIVARMRSIGFYFLLALFSRFTVIDDVISDLKSVHVSGHRLMTIIHIHLKIYFLGCSTIIIVTISCQNSIFMRFMGVFRNRHIHCNFLKISIHLHVYESLNTF